MAKAKELGFPETLSLARREAEEETRGLPALRTRLEKLEVRTPKVYEELMEAGRKVREIDRRVEDKQKSMTKLCDALKKHVLELFRPIRRQCDDVLSLIAEKREKYDGFLEDERKEREERAQREAERELKRLQKKAERLAAKAPSRVEAKEILAEVPQLDELIVPVAEQEAPKVEGVSVVKIWDFEILDPQAVPETLYPTELHPGCEYWVLWERIFSRRALMACREAGIEVPGVRFFQKDSVRYERL